jgi:hypothetical protein
MKKKKIKNRKKRNPAVFSLSLIFSSCVLIGLRRSSSWKNIPPPSSSSALPTRRQKPQPSSSRRSYPVVGYFLLPPLPYLPRAGFFSTRALSSLLPRGASPAGVLPSRGAPSLPISPSRGSPSSPQIRQRLDQAPWLVAPSPASAPTPDSSSDRACCSARRSCSLELLQPCPLSSCSPMATSPVEAQPSRSLPPALYYRGSQLLPGHLRPYSLLPLLARGALCSSSPCAQAPPAAQPSRVFLLPAFFLCRAFCSPRALAFVVATAPSSSLLSMRARLLLCPWPCFSARPLLLLCAQPHPTAWLQLIRRARVSLVFQLVVRRRPR